MILVSMVAMMGFSQTDEGCVEGVREQVQVVSRIVRDMYGLSSGIHSESFLRTGVRFAQGTSISLADGFPLMRGLFSWITSQRSVVALPHHSDEASSSCCPVVGERWLHRRCTAISDGQPAGDQAVGRGVPGPADTPVFNRFVVTKIF